MKVLITCGPAIAPIDEVRRITNFSSGKLGAFLSDYFSEAGWEVLCLRGTSATHPAPLKARKVLGFTTNEDLRDQLDKVAQCDPPQVILHAAALCDYEVASVASADGRSLQGAKLSSRAGDLTLTLKPARKILPLLRPLLPQAILIGWTYELEGSTGDALEKAWAQIQECKTDGCVLNGRAYGDGFALCQPPGHILHFDDAESLARSLEKGLRWRLTGTPPLPGECPSCSGPSRQF
jgi:phosphopantothenoylcysteine synthetase/decarboxylase